MAVSALALFVLASAGSLFAQRGIAIGSKVDPYILLSGDIAPGYANTVGRTQKSSVVAAFPTAAIIVTVGQSNCANSAAGAFTPVNSLVENFNIADGAIYGGINPVLGASTSALGTNSATLNIADRLISASTFTRVIMAPICIAATKAADWAVGGVYNHRIVVLMKRLAAIGLLPTYVMWHQGENDNGVTAGPAYTASVQSAAQTFRDNGLTGPMFVALETMSGNVTSATIRTAQTNAISAPLNIVAGADWDNITGGTNRAADGTHFTAAGADTAAALDTTVITNYKNSH